MLDLCLGLQDSQVLRRAIVYALRPRMQVPSGADFTAPQSSSEPEAWTPQPLGMHHLRLILPVLLMLLVINQNTLHA
jgi:hypothetical protein